MITEIISYIFRVAQQIDRAIQSMGEIISPFLQVAQQINRVSQSIGNIICLFAYFSTTNIRELNRYLKVHHGPGKITGSVIFLSRDRDLWRRGSYSFSEFHFSWNRIFNIIKCSFKEY
jgi:hypothetical protein